MSAIRDAIVSYLADRDVPVHVAAAIAGNFSVESNRFNPAVISGEVRGDKGKAAYLAQWRDDRLDKLQEFAASRNEKVPSIPTQLDFMALELTPGNKYTDAIAAKNRDAIFNARNLEDATAAFAKHYERAGTPHLAQRQDAAKAAFEGYFSSRTTNAPTPTPRADALRDAVLAQVQPPATPAPTLASAAPAAAPALARNDFVSPMGALGDRVVSGYGFRDAPQTAMGRGSTNHRGVDLTPALGQGAMFAPVQAVASGVVTHAGPKGGYGQMVEITHADGSRSRYAHLGDPDPKNSRFGQPINVTVGQEVARGTPIGVMGNTGKSTGPHLHFEMFDPQGRPINPASVIDFSASRSVPTPTSRNDVLASTPHSGTPARAAQEASMAALAQQQAQMAQAAAPAPHAGPSARSAQETSMAALQQQQAPSVASAHVGPSARSAQEVSMAALNQSQAPATISGASAAPVQASATSVPSIGFGSAPQFASAAPAFAATSAPSVTPTARAQDAFGIESRAQQDPAFTQAALSQAANSRVADAWGISGPPARGAEIASMAALAAYNDSKANSLASTPAQSLAAAAQSPIQASVPSLNQAPTLNAPAAPSFASTPALGTTPTARPDNIASAIVQSAVNPTPQNSASSQSRHNYAPISDYLSKDTGGIFGKDGIFSATNVQNAVVSGLGGVAGGVIGGAALGPLGGLIGSALGRHVAQQQFGVKPAAPIAPLSVPEFNALMAANYTPGLSFPTAPIFDTIHHYEAGGGPSYSDMAAISPGAADAISEGRGGLY